jgi:hypothetical protein
MLHNNQLGVVGGRALASALRHNCTLKTLDLWGSALGADGVGAIARALETNTSLKELRLRENDAGTTANNKVTNVGA